MIDQMHVAGVQRLLGRIIPGPFVFRQSLRISDELRAEIEAQDREISTVNAGDPIGKKSGPPSPACFAAESTSIPSQGA